MFTTLPKDQGRFKSPFVEAMLLAFPVVAKDAPKGDPIIIANRAANVVGVNPVTACTAGKVLGVPVDGDQALAAV
jgi:hypothetical protein